MGEAKNKLVKEACEKFNKGEMEKNFIKFIQRKDQTGIRQDKGLQVLHYMEHLVLPKKIWIRESHKQRKIMNSSEHPLAYL